MRVLITGCNGQVGYCLTEQLNRKENTVVLALTRDDLDITDATAVQKIVFKFNPNVIINAAAHTAVDSAEKEMELSYKINRDGPKYLAEAAQKINAAMLHISTDYVFSGDKDGQYSPEDPTAPQGVYGQSKLAGEQAVIEACDKHIILRTAWVFGEHGNNFVKTMLRLGKDRDALSIVGDQFGGPTYAGDIADALIEIATQIEQGKSIEYGVYHFSGYPHVSWFEFAQAIFSEVKTQQVLNNIPALSSIPTTEYPTPAKRPANSKLATDKIMQSFGIEASDWQAALNQVKHYT
ncbi:dTDP-4-dehydrorhamnose reductase [Moritella sp.]|uniref:dTDP-4-dehydrorhamnose reductase n=1 Tax=Moritella sp. TaxID=78556 RepID=UPI001D229D11|nr:dTDP-4-dehydrorhamnose reductase [Moritella sp.]MCJ8347973.1 dTDP-4-dehydrorhamnose reductase [Moritella sp.]NQZ40354.1 dTDP-4-dehydrorhamnose reductase [Moritella sp.]